MPTIAAMAFLAAVADDLARAHAAGDVDGAARDLGRMLEHYPRTARPTALVSARPASSRRF